MHLCSIQQVYVKDMEREMSECVNIPYVPILLVLMTLPLIVGVVVLHYQLCVYCSKAILFKLGFMFVS